MPTKGGLKINAKNIGSKCEEIDMYKTNSTAVMQRRVEPKDSLDDFPTPPWATRALIEHVIGPQSVDGKSVWEPACNRGYLAKVLEEYFSIVSCSDIHDYGYVMGLFDFLKSDKPFGKHDWIITNPPFKLAEDFFQESMRQTTEGVAFILRTSFLEGKGRYRNIFSKNPPSIVAQFVERVPMVKGRYDPTAVSATSYAWFIWKHNSDKQTKLVWIPPCRKQLEKEGDYDLPMHNGR